MAKEWRSVVFDADLQVESYMFRGVLQKFPNHFHEHYVIGLIEGGRRALVCKGRSYTLGPGDLVFFNPRDNHTCAPVGDGGLDYRFLNIQPEVMARVAGDITGREGAPIFVRSVAAGGDLIPDLRELHDLIMEGEKTLRKEELFFFLLGQILTEHADADGGAVPARPHPAVETVRAYLEAHYVDNVTLDELSALAGQSKYHLLRCFTRHMGISPYSYLETLRIDQARRLLERGVPLAEAAQRTGFADQSHFTRFFKQVTGVTPGQYRSVFLGDGP